MWRSGSIWPEKFQYATIWFCAMHINLETQPPACYAYCSMLKTLLAYFEVRVGIRIDQKMFFLRSKVYGT